MKTSFSNYADPYIWIEMNGRHRTFQNRSGCPNANTLDEHFAEAPDLMGGSDKDEKLPALVPLNELMMVIVFEDEKNVSIIYDINVFQSEKKRQAKRLA